MPTHLSFEYTHEEELPPGHTTEVRTPDALVEWFLREYSSPGDSVLDIFAGYGTTLRVAERLGRIPYGIEFETDRVSYVQEYLSDPDRIRQGDARTLDLSWVPSCTCCFTSPPFMERTDDRNPFENYTGQSTYDEYLEDVETAFSRLDAVIEPNGCVIVDIANMKHEGRVTTLAWDVADRVSNVFHFDGEYAITWEDTGESDDRTGAFGYGYDHSYCLVFRKITE